MISKVVSIDELLQRIGLQPKSNIWSAIISNPVAFQDVIEDLQESIENFAECQVVFISGEVDTIDFIEQIQQAPEDYLILSNFEAWNRDNWRKFDALRSRLDQQKRGGILVLSSTSAQNMFKYAPNFMSWLGSRIYDFQPGGEFLNSEEREQRLSALRAWSGLSDSQVIELAESHQLSPDPEYGEWLILLDRGDLIEG